MSTVAARCVSAADDAAPPPWNPLKERHEWRQYRKIPVSCAVVHFCVVSGVNAP
ncbi:Hypothetical protein SMAX5B_016792 [Scophthalmus maximus]|uniref:Uncharacterized protein n=1 Tax=Scophthalmus maximus TaxID=52904 RepID=A0A2U9CDN0_SCOMX|nr:Hypothetical protein SMAX5B_016792 [Scophthalmus maximus]